MPIAGTSWYRCVCPTYPLFGPCRRRIAAAVAGLAPDGNPPCLYRVPLYYWHSQRYVWTPLADRVMAHRPGRRSACCSAPGIDVMKERGLPLLVVPGDARAAQSTRGGRPLVSEYDGRQFVGIDLHRRRTVIVRHDRSGRAAGLRADHQRSAGAGPGDRQGRPSTGGGDRGDLRLVLGGGRARRGRGPGASGASVGDQGVRQSAGEERRARRRRPGGPAADGSAAGGVDRATGGAGAARAGPPPGQAGRVRSGFKAEVHGVLAKQGLHVPVNDLFGAARASRAGHGSAGPGLPGPDRIATLR